MIKKQNIELSITEARKAIKFAQKEIKEWEKFIKLIQKAIDEKSKKNKTNK